ncbi:hypothetical protein N692_00465 [Lactiplantibacillus plantarum EGD-AQ4]|nr:hypothetical protein N692_00465 [Lactiplantibacillus plantarum EGD-AQ4]
MIKICQLQPTEYDAQLGDLVPIAPLCSDNLLMYDLKIAGLFELPIGYWYHQSELSAVNSSHHYQ